MSKKSSLEMLTAKTSALGGGAEKTKSQQELGKSTARQRIADLLDEGSFVELDKFVERSLATPGFESVSAAGEGVVTGFGTISSRPCYVYVQDFTVLNGSVSRTHAEKIVKIMDMAVKNGAPVVGIIDCGGARVAEGAAVMNAYGMIAKKLSDISGVVPTIAVVAGDCIGAMNFVVAMNDFVVAVDKISDAALFGPQVMASATEGKYDGGAAAQNEKYATAQFMAESEAEAYATVKQIIDIMPANNMEDSMCELNEDDLNRLIPEFDAEENVDTKDIISKVFDGGKFLEYQAMFGTGIITGLAQLAGYTVGVVANNNGAALCGNCAKKAARFISIMDAFNIPVITITDTADLNTDTCLCVSNSIAKLMQAYASATVPMINVIVGKAVSTGLAAMCSKAMGADMVYAWANATISAMPVEAGAFIVYEKEINEGLSKEEAFAKYEEEYANAFEAAKQGVVDDVIAPSATRQMLCAAIEACIVKKEAPIAKKHGIMPL